jgi:hypothetical protein
MAEGDTHVCLICGHSKFEEEMFTWLSSDSLKSPSICQETDCLQMAYNSGLFKPRYMRDVEDMWANNPYLLTEQPLRLKPMSINQRVMVR